MLGWGKTKSDHPMADERGAKEFLAELPAGDAFKALAEISFWLDATRTAEGLKPQRIYEIIDQLDQDAAGGIGVRISEHDRRVGISLQCLQQCAHRLRGAAMLQGHGMIGHEE